jgi:hypothetical protein
LFRKYPYLLPCLIASSIAFADVLFGVFFLDEVNTAKAYIVMGNLLRCSLDTSTQKEKAS